MSLILVILSVLLQLVRGLSSDESQNNADLGAEVLDYSSSSTDLDTSSAVTDSLSDDGTSSSSTGSWSSSVEGEPHPPLSVPKGPVLYRQSHLTVLESCLLVMQFVLRQELILY